MKLWLNYPSRCKNSLLHGDLERHSYDRDHEREELSVRSLVLLLYHKTMLAAVSGEL